MRSSSARPERGGARPQTRAGSRPTSRPPAPTPGVHAKRSRDSRLTKYSMNRVRAHSVTAETDAIVECLRLCAPGPLRADGIQEGKRLLLCFVVPYELRLVVAQSTIQVGGRPQRAGAAGLGV